MSSMPNPESPIRIADVAVRRGRRLVLEAVSLEVPAGGVTALIGRNGAGKSSLIACLAGLAPVSRGTVCLLGLDPWRHRRRLVEQIAFVPEMPDAPPGARVAELVAFDRAMLPRFDEAGAWRRLARGRISRSARAGELSRGQRTQLALALALARRPEVLLLDDPTLGLDPAARRLLIDELIEELAERGPTVFLATHDLDLAERLAGRIAILADRRVAVDEPLEELRERVRRVTLDPLVAPPPEIHVLAELGADALGREILVTGAERGQPATLSEIVTAHLDPGVLR